MREERKLKVSECVFYCKKTHRYLIALRSKEVTEPLTWAGWGGALEGKEPPEVTAQRKVAEKTGFAGSMDLVKAWESNTEELTYTTFVAFVEEEFTPKINWETDAYYWCDFKELPINLHPGLEESLPGIIKVVFQY